MVTYIIVDPHVLRQVTLEHLVADWAVERLYVLMETGQVLVQCVRSEESLATPMTSKVPLILVRLDVQFQIRRTRECSVALATAVSLMAVMSAPMLR